MQTGIAKRKEKFQTEIRKQGLSKILRLKRIKPRLVESTQDALTILVHGIQIMQNQSSEEELIEALKSMSESIKKYEFHVHSKMIKQSIQNVKWIITDSRKRDIVKEAALQFLMLLCFSYCDIVELKDLQFQILEGFKQFLVQKSLKMIRLTLISLSQLMANFHQYNFNILMEIVKDEFIFKRFLMIIANFGNKRQCFEMIKIPFVYCAVSLCYVSFKWGVNKNENEFLKILQFSTSILENDIIMEAQQDKTLKVFFQKYYRAQTQDIYDPDVYEIAYPFCLLQLTAELLKQENRSMMMALIQCLDFQIEHNCVQRPLVVCLIKIFKETQMYFETDMRQKIFIYIFGMSYIGQKNNGNIQEIILLALNNSVNDQSPDESIFNIMSDCRNERYPKTGRLIQLMDYFDERDDPVIQQHLMLLVINYLIYNGSNHYIEESAFQLSKYEGAKFSLREIGFDVDEQGSQTEFHQLQSQNDYFE